MTKRLPRDYLVSARNPTTSPRTEPLREESTPNPVTILGRSFDQKQRRVASAPPATEPRPRRLDGYRHLPLLRVALQREGAWSTHEHEGVA